MMADLLEEWRTVTGSNDRYQVSNLGRVRVMLPPGKYRKEAVYKNIVGSYSSHKSPYISITMTRNDKTRVTRLLHQLVMQEFVGPMPPDKNVIAHNNGNSLDNRLENLRYATYKENEADKKLHGTDSRGSRNPFAKLGDWEIGIIKELFDHGISQAKIAKLFNVSFWAINDICRGKSWKHIVESI